MSKNVLHLSTERAWRGGENQLLMLLKGSVSENVKNHVVVQPKSELGQRFAPFASVHEISMRNDVDILGAWGIAQLVRTGRIDIIHAHAARGHSLGILAKKILRCLGGPLPVLIVHRRVEQKANLSLLERWKYQNKDIDQYICISQAVAQGLVACGTSSNRIRIIRSAVDAAEFTDGNSLRTQVRRELGLASDAFVACFVGAVEEAKGIIYLLQAWSEFKTQAPSARLIVVGNGDLLERLKGENPSAETSGVLFTGFRNDSRRILAASDVLVLPTLWEGLGTVLLEGLLAGCALIASNVGGVPEIVLDKKTGLLVPPRDPDAIAFALKSLYESKSLSDQLVAAGQTHVAQNFSVDVMVKSILSCYFDLHSNARQNANKSKSQQL